MILLPAQYRVDGRPPSSACATTQLELAKKKLAIDQAEIAEEKQRLEKLKAELKAPAKPQKTLALGFAGSIGARPCSPTDIYVFSTPFKKSSYSNKEPALDRVVRCQAEGRLEGCHGSKARR